MTDPSAHLRAPTRAQISIHLPPPRVPTAPDSASRGPRSRATRAHRHKVLGPTVTEDVVHVRLDALRIKRPRQWGACWLALDLWNQLDLDRFWSDKLLPSRKGTRWLNVLKTLTCYRLIDPGSEWRLHRHWYDQSAMADLLGEDFGVAQIDTLYRCLDKLVTHKTELFSHLTERWKTLFDARFDVLLYDLTSTYFECDPPADPEKDLALLLQRLRFELPPQPPPKVSAQIHNGLD